MARAGAPPLRIAAPRDFRFLTTVRSHGWYDLQPFAFDGSALSFPLTLGKATVDAQLAEVPGEPALSLSLTAPKGARLDQSARRRATATVASMLRLDEDLTPFYARTDGDQRLAFARPLGMGRLLRAPTAWEDTVKMLLTTNCTWSLTRQMVGRLVEQLGPAAPSGRRAFPDAARVAERDAAYYRDVIKVGYRAPFLVELARRVAAGEVDLERPRTAHSPSDLDAAALRKELLALPGIGPYAADNLLRLHGAYANLGLDSWCRAQLKQLMPRARDVDAAAARRYAPYREWAGLAMWVEITRRWHEAGQGPPGATT